MHKFDAFIYKIHIVTSKINITVFSTIFQYKFKKKKSIDPEKKRLTITHTWYYVHNVNIFSSVYFFNLKDIIPVFVGRYLPCVGMCLCAYNLLRGVGRPNCETYGTVVERFCPPSGPSSRRAERWPTFDLIFAVRCAARRH